MKVKVKKISEGAVLPYKKYNEDFCYDVVATSCEEVAPNVYKYGLGLAFQIERRTEKICCGKAIMGIDFEGKRTVMDIEKDTFVNFQYSDLNLSLDFRPRSSVWQTGMVLSNCTGTIDELYTGEVSAVFYHIMPNMPKYEVGDRIGQIKIGMTFPIEFVEVEELDKTARGAGGYGSTGK
jgi:dUTP pyrophosphatase